MCTSIVVNRKKTVVGWNLDLLGMEHRVRTDARGVYIEINDANSPALIKSDIPFLYVLMPLRVGA